MMKDRAKVKCISNALKKVGARTILILRSMGGPSDIFLTTYPQKTLFESRLPAFVMLTVSIFITYHIVAYPDMGRQWLTGSIHRLTS